MANAIRLIENRGPKRPKRVIKGKGVALRNRPRRPVEDVNRVTVSRLSRDSKCDEAEQHELVFA